MKLGTASSQPRLNFAATNAFQAVQTFSEAVAIARELDSIEVEKSPFCRYGSECWDVKLKFFDPENDRRAKKVFRFTIDVSDRRLVTYTRSAFLGCIQITPCYKLLNSKNVDKSSEKDRIVVLTKKFRC